METARYQCTDPTTKLPLQWGRGRRFDRGAVLSFAGDPNHPPIQSFSFVELGRRVVTLASHLESGVSTMNWISRLLPNDRRAPKRIRSRRRRMMDLDRLETRTVLSNVSAVLSGSALVITGDTFNDNIIITQNLGGSVTVSPGTPKVIKNVVVPGSTI